MSNYPSHFVDSLNSLSDYPLTDEQLCSVFDDSHRQLLIAAAGSGKSSTLIAKVYYLLLSGQAQPEQICVLAYNEDAQSHLRQRFNQILQQHTDLQSEIEVAQGLMRITNQTFHAFGLDVIARENGFKPSIHPLASMRRQELMQFFAERLNELANEDPQFAKDWHSYLALAKYPRPKLQQIPTLKAYNDYLIQMGAVYHLNKAKKRIPSFTALDGTKVRSLEALSISNWLWMHGVPYRYLSPIGGSANKSLYADFYYLDIDVYHFHTALDQARKSPKFLGNYPEQLKKRRQAAHRLEVDKFETHSGDFDSGEIFKKLEQKLLDYGVIFKPRSETDISKAVLSCFNPDKDLTIFESFLRHYKANNSEITIFCDQDKEDKDPLRSDLFQRVFEPLYQRYQSILQQSEQIDFNDQINSASDLIEQRAYQHGFKYILVDEFQDISQDRKRLLQVLLSQQANCKLFAVGDDWQSIYRFSGSDIDIMTHFDRHFGPTQINYLTQTFRSYQGIVDVASDFVMKNPNQLQKNVQAQANLKQPLVFIQSYQNGHEHEKGLWQLLQKLNAVAVKRQTLLSVFLLARYHRLKPENYEWFVQRLPNLQIEFKSIHASKGLEADYVLVLSIESGAYGFPSTLNDDPLLHKVIPQPEEFASAEERRLMYVALTRAKRAVYLFSHVEDASPFIYELAEHKGVIAEDCFVEADLCPKCHSGQLKERRGPWGIFFGCSHYPACDYSESKYCPECGQGKMVAREGENGRFYACSCYPDCRYTEN